MKTFQDYLEIAGGFTADDNPYIKKAQDDKKRMNPVTFKALYDDMWEILGEDDPLHGDTIPEDDYSYAPLKHSKENGSDVFTGTMDDFEKFFFKFGVTGSEFADWFNNNTERTNEPDWSKLGSNPRRE